MKRHYCLLILVSIVALGCSSQKLSSKTSSVAGNDGQFKDLGNQVAGGSIQGGTFYSDAAGNEYVYTISRGKPAHLLGYNLKGNKLITDIELPHEAGSWDMEITSDGWLYAGGNDGRLFKHRPGSKMVEDLGQHLGTQTVVYDLAAGNNGEIFGGTYGGARVFRYHPADGYTDLGSGPVVPGEQYVRSLDFQSKTGKIYAGVGAHAHLIELDPKTGSKKQLLPDEFKHHEFVYNIAVVPGFSTGDRLFAWLHSGDHQETLIYNLATGTLEKTRSIQVKTAIKDPENDKAYYLASGKLYSQDFSKPGQNATLLATIGDSTGLDAMWGKDKKLKILTVNKHIIKYDPANGHVSITDLNVPSQPLKINSIVAGPDGRIWTAGYLAGGHAAYDPKTGITKQYPGIDQAEGMTVQGDKIYIGVYPTAKIYVYDTKRKWDPANGNPRLIKQIEGQDRPYAGAAAPSIGKMFFGTVPRYGKLGGTLLEYNMRTDVLSTYAHVIPKQSVVSLVYAGGLIYGGSTVRGGNGILATEKEAKLFGWDPDAQKKVFEIIPVAGARAITCLVNGPDGNIWGIADGVLFIFNSDKKEVISQKTLYPFPKTGDGTYIDASLIIHPSGIVYGTGGGNLFKIDPKTMEYTVLRKGARFLTMDKEGTFYTVMGETLWQFKP